MTKVSRFCRSELIERKLYLKILDIKGNQLDTYEKLQDISNSNIYIAKDHKKMI